MDFIVRGVTKTQTRLSHSHFGGPGVKNLPCNAADAGSISGQGTKIPHVMEKLSRLMTQDEQSLILA